MSLDATDMHAGASLEVRNIRATEVYRRFDQLNTTLVGAADGAWTYLMTINGGGAASILAFIAAVPDQAKQRWPFIGLALFTFGLILVGAGRAVMVLKFNELTTNWIDKTADYYSGKLGWRAVHHDDDARVERHKHLPWLLGWSSLVCFLLGVALVGISMKIPPG